MNRQLEFNEERPDTSSYLLEMMNRKTNLCLFLDGLQDVRNISMIIRLADAANLESIYLHNCAPLTNVFLKKVARSKHHYVPLILIEKNEFPEKENESLWLALDKTTQSICYTDFEPPRNRRIVLVIGAEKKGVSQDLLNRVHNSIHLPMLGMGTSMNVACATSIAVYHLISRMKIAQFC